MVSALKAKILNDLRQFSRQSSIIPRLAGFLTIFDAAGALTCAEGGFDLYIGILILTAPK
jgi:hypothetical protein